MPSVPLAPYLPHFAPLEVWAGLPHPALLVLPANLLHNIDLSFFLNSSCGGCHLAKNSDVLQRALQFCCCSRNLCRSCLSLIMASLCIISCLGRIHHMLLLPSCLVATSKFCRPSTCFCLRWQSFFGPNLILHFSSPVIHLQLSSIPKCSARGAQTSSLEESTLPVLHSQYRIWQFRHVTRVPIFCAHGAYSHNVSTCA